jgi:hypothetical protein
VVNVRGGMGAGMRAAWGEQRSERHVLVARALADSAVFRFAMRAPAAAAEGLAHAAAVYQRALDVGPPHQPGTSKTLAKP